MTGGPARSILFPGGGITLTQAAELASAFDGAGFHGLYCVEAYRSGFVPLSVLAQATTRCRVGTYILNAHAHPPIAAVMAARDVDELSGGRTVLGVGSGNPHINEWHLGASNAQPLTTMREYVTALRGALGAAAGATVEFSYRGKQIRWVPSIRPVREQMPVYLAAMYPKMRQLAAQSADGIAMGSLHSAEYVRDVIRPTLVRSLEHLGRDASTFRFLSSALVAVHEDPQAARTLARRGLCRLFTPLPHPYYEYILREQGWSAMVDDIAAEMRDGSLESALDKVPDEAVDSLLIAGSPGDCERAIARYDGVLDEIVLADATSVGASIDPGTSGTYDGLRTLLSLAPSGSS
jgi:alkanesulfonate monooxygenase SsuD/methylene tetrahydromethanopterin reductase-like flavin-dependent oxidoreductase (luciferase family)